VAIGWFILSHLASSVISKLSISNVSIKLGSLSASGLPIFLPITIQNNSSASIPLHGFDGLLFYGSHPIAPVIINKAVTISANQSTTIEVRSFINILDLASDLYQIIVTKKFLDNLRLVGNLQYHGITIPVSQVIKII
jgi:LEA14-like dessication related protein